MAREPARTNIGGWSIVLATWACSIVSWLFSSSSDDLLRITAEPKASCVLVFYYFWIPFLVPSTKWSTHWSMEGTFTTLFSVARFWSLPDYLLFDLPTLILACSRASREALIDLSWLLGWVYPSTVKPFLASYFLSSKLFSLLWLWFLATLTFEIEYAPLSFELLADELILDIERFVWRTLTN